MTNHHKLLFLQNSDIPNHLSVETRLHLHPLVESDQQDFQKKVWNLRNGKISFQPFTKVSDLMYAAKHLRITPIDWLPSSLVSQSLRFHLTEAPISDFLTDFPMDFDVGFLDRFPAGDGCHTLDEEDWPVKTGDRLCFERIFMTNNSPAAISNACYTAYCTNFDP